MDKVIPIDTCDYDTKVGNNETFLHYCFGFLGNSERLN